MPLTMLFAGEFYYIMKTTRCMYAIECSKPTNYCKLPRMNGRRGSKLRELVACQGLLYKACDF